MSATHTPGLRRLTPTTHEMRVEYRRVPEWERWDLVGSDCHFDSVHCDRKMLGRLFQEAERRGADVWHIGDWHDCMGGRFDRRGQKSELRPEHATAPAYLDSIVDRASDFLAQWPTLRVFLSRGNHEQSVRKNTEVDIHERTVALANYKRRALDPAAPVVESGGYAGWIVWKYQQATGAGICSRTVHYDHGAGGGGPVTKGAIGANRRAVYLPDADEVWSGHIHELWCIEYARERLDRSGTPYSDPQYHVCLGTMKEERVGQSEGFHVERGAPPKPKGWFWRRSYYSPDLRRVCVQYIQTEK